MEENLFITRRRFVGLAAAGTAILAMPELEGCPSLSSWIATVDSDMPEVLNIVNSILAVVSVATGNGAITAVASAAVNIAVNLLKASLQTLSDAVAAYKASQNPTTLEKLVSALTAAQADVPRVLSALPVVVSTPVATVITAGIGTVIVILSSLQTLIPGAAPAAVRANMVAASLKATLPNAASIRSGFYAVLMLHGYGDQLAR